MRELIETVKKAGIEIMEIYGQEDFGIEIKPDESPITLADKAANKVIVSELKRLYPEIPILSEESKILPYSERMKWNHCFIVDPIDGTKEFIKRNGQFTVNIGLWKCSQKEEPGKMLGGIIYAPAMDLLYFTDEGSAFRVKEGKEERLPCESIKTFTMVASNSHLNEATQNHLDELRNKHDTVDLKRVGSSLKMCMIAEGSAHYYPRLGPTSEWDTAASQAILEASGASMTQLESNQPMQYNKENILNPHFLVRREF